MAPFYALITPIASPPGSPGYPGHPAHPIHIPWPGDPGWGAPPGWGPGGPGQNPPGIWGGGNEPFPTPPINLPPWGGGGPGGGGPGGGPGKPPGIWGGGNQPFPTPPIVVPPGTPIPPGTDIIWPPQGPLAGIEHPITIVPEGKVMVYVNGWVIVDKPDQPPAKPHEGAPITPGGPGPKK